MEPTKPILKGKLKVERWVDTSSNLPYKVQFSVDVVEGSTKLLPPQFIEKMWKDLGVSTCGCWVFREPSCPRGAKTAEDAHKFIEKVRENFHNLCKEISDYFSSLNYGFEGSEEIPFEISATEAKVEQYTYPGEPIRHWEERIKELLESAPEPPAEKYTKKGEIISYEDEKFICGTGHGHFYPVITQTPFIALGIRKLKTQPDCARVRVQCYEEPPESLTQELELLGFEARKRDCEKGHHYSAIFPVAKAIEVAAKIAYLIHQYC